MGVSKHYRPPTPKICMGFNRIESSKVYVNAKYIQNTFKTPKILHSILCKEKEKINFWGFLLLYTFI